MSQHNTKSVDAQCHEWAHNALCLAEYAYMRTFGEEEHAAYHIGNLANQIIAARIRADLGECARFVLAQHADNVMTALEDCEQTAAVFAHANEWMAQRYRTSAAELRMLAQQVQP